MPRTSKKTTKARTSKATARATTSASQRQPLSVKQFNLIIALLHFLQGVAILVFSGASKGLTPISMPFIARDELASQATGGTVMAAASRHLFDLNLAHVIAAFFFVAALTHLLIATRLRNRYEVEHKSGFNRTRTFGFAIVASLLTVTVGMVVGVWSLPVLLLLMALVIVAKTFHFLMDARNREAGVKRWWPFWLGVKYGLEAWIIIGLFVWAAAVYGNGLPAYAYWLAGTTFLLFGGFALIGYKHHNKQGKWADYGYTDMAYVWLSVVTTAAVAWQVFAGALA